MDYLAGGRFRATLHRVVNKTGAARYSIPFFYEPNMEAVLEPLISADDPRKKVSLLLSYLQKNRKPNNQKVHSTHRPLPPMWNVI